MNNFSPSSIPNPSFQDSLMELYHGNQRRQEGLQIEGVQAANLSSQQPVYENERLERNHLNQTHHLANDYAIGSSSQFGGQNLRNHPINEQFNQQMNTATQILTYNDENGRYRLPAPSHNDRYISSNGLVVDFNSSGDDAVDGGDAIPFSSATANGNSNDSNGRGTLSHKSANYFTSFNYSEGKVHSSNDLLRESCSISQNSINTMNKSNSNKQYTIKSNKKKIGTVRRVFPLVSKMGRDWSSYSGESSSDDDSNDEHDISRIISSSRSTTACISGTTASVPSPSSPENVQTPRRNTDPWNSNTSSDKELLREIFLPEGIPVRRKSEDKRQHHHHQYQKDSQPKESNNIDVSNIISNVEHTTLTTGTQPFTSALGRRVWSNYMQNYRDQNFSGTNGDLIVDFSRSTDDLHGKPSSKTKGQYERNLSMTSHETIPSFTLSTQHLPPSEFLKLPSTMIRVYNSSYNDNIPFALKQNNQFKWVDTEELERKVLQCHLDFETSEAMSTTSSLVEGRSGNTNLKSTLLLPSSLIASDCFTRVIYKDPRLGLGMTLREYGGCVYIQGLLKKDGSRMDCGADHLEMGLDEENCSGPAFEAGLRPGDRLLGLNGRAFLRGRLARDGKVIGNNVTLASPAMKYDADDVLKSVAAVISTAPSPLIVHVQRERDVGLVLAMLRRLPAESTQIGDHSFRSSAPNTPVRAEPYASSTQNGSFWKSNAKSKPNGPYIHPFAKAMTKRKLLKSGKDEIVVTQQIRIFTDRTRQWESKLSFRLRASDFTLRPRIDARDVEPSYYASFFADDGDIPTFFSYKFAKNIRSYAPSTPMIEDWRLTRHRGDIMVPSPRQINGNLSREAAVLADLYAGLDEDDAEVQSLFIGGKIGVSNGDIMNRRGGGLAYPINEKGIMNAMSDPSDIFVPLVGVRKALCVRILNSFLDNKNRTAFTIWAYDIEAGVEWYAPARYYADFRDLRSELIRLDKSISEIPFPSMGWAGFTGMTSDASDSASTKETRRSQLEYFLRRVFSGMYRGQLHPYLAEVAVHLQTFVGCDTVLSDDNDISLTLNNQVAISEATYCTRTPDASSEQERNARLHLKRSIQRYVYRLFLLPSVENLVSQFIDAAKKKVVSETNANSKKSQSNQLKVDKDKATDDVEKIREFIDSVQELILEGCEDDFVSISQRRDFAALKDDCDNTKRDELFREAVREQVEIEIYVPLRSTISKHLVYAWLNDDVEMKHKMKALSKKPQSFFRIHPEHRSPSEWKSVSTILKEGVGRSTLPCVKLRAIVDAAKEITKLDSEERSYVPEESFFDGKVVTKTKALGADDFLPIFIFCFVRADIERPSALCALLQTMCDPAKLNGETGYYLASFYAAMTHIHELDLSEANDDLSIFMDTLVP